MIYFESNPSIRRDNIIIKLHCSSHFSLQKPGRGYTFLLQAWSINFIKNTSGFIMEYQRTQLLPATRDWTQDHGDCRTSQRDHLHALRELLQPLARQAMEQGASRSDSKSLNTAVTDPPYSKSHCINTLFIIRLESIQYWEHCHYFPA